MTAETMKVGTGCVQVLEDLDYSAIWETPS